MQNKTKTLQGPAFEKTSRIVSLIAALGLLATVTGADANQVYKACGKKWARQAAKLTPEQLAWLMEQRAARLDRDLDGDGLDDQITMTSTPSFRHCDVKSNWNQKETMVRIDYGNGKSQIFHWIGAQLVERMSLHPAIGKILVAGVDARGSGVSKWVAYRQGETPEPIDYVAHKLPEPVVEDEGLTIAGLQ